MCQVCTCLEGYFNAGETCEKLRRPGESCTTYGQCVISSECSTEQGGLCVCDQGQSATASHRPKKDRPLKLLSQLGHASAKLGVLSTVSSRVLIMRCLCSPCSTPHALGGVLGSAQLIERKEKTEYAWVRCIMAAGR